MAGSVLQWLICMQVRASLKRDIPVSGFINVDLLENRTE